MKVRTAFSFCFSALVLAGIAAVAMAEGRFLFIPASLGMFALRSYLLEREQRVYLSKIGATVLNCVAFMFVGLDVKYVSGQLMLSMAHFLVLVQLIRLFEAKRARDYGLMAMMAVIHIAVASIVSLEFVLAIPLLVVFLAVPPTLMLLTLLQGIEDSRGGVVEGDVLLLPEAATMTVGAPFWGTAAVAGSTSFALGIVIFAFMPRLRTEFFGQEAMADPVAVTGFDQEVQLEDIGEIKQNTAEVMKVWIERNGQPFKPAGVDPYFRGVTLETYDGRRWSSITNVSDYTSVQVRSGFERLRYPGAALRPLLEQPGGVEVDQRVTIQPIDTRTIFALQYPTAIESKRIRTFGFEPMSQALALGQRPTTRAFTYTVRSIVYPRTPERVARLRAAQGKTPTFVTRWCLSLPPTLSSRVKDLAKRIAPAGPDATEFDRVAAIERYFVESREFVYTLNIEGFKGRDPIETFLFDKKEGHCAFFASAMVVLLRSIGIPARMVNGFYGGEWNEFGSYYTVRQSDAHSWVEVYFPNVGWATFDPTPARARGAEAPSGFYSSVVMFIDYLDSLWLTHVVGYSQDPTEDQVLGVVGKVRRWLSRFQARLSGDARPSDFLELSTPNWRTATPYIVLGAFFAGVVAVLFLARAMGLRLVTRLSGASRSVPSIAFYRRFLDTMARKGYPKSPFQTPAEYLRELAGLPRTEVARAEIVTRRFCAMRYGAEAATPAEEARVEECLAALKQLPHRPKGETEEERQ